jgi:hypothetical protein
MTFLTDLLLSLLLLLRVKTESVVTMGLVMCSLLPLRLEALVRMHTNGNPVQMAGLG